MADDQNNTRLRDHHQNAGGDWRIRASRFDGEAGGSTCHGAGRTMSRSRAKKEVRGSDLKQRLEARGISVRAGSLAGLAEEAPVAYKDVDNVVDVVDGAGIARKVARLRPIGVVKG